MRGWPQLLTWDQQDHKYPEMPRSPGCSRSSCGVWGKELCHSRDMLPFLSLLSSSEGRSESSDREWEKGKWIWELPVLLAGHEGMCKPSWAAPRWRKDLITQKCFQFQLRVIQLFAQVPINSGQNFLQFSSKPCTDLSVGCSRAEQSP